MSQFLIRFDRAWMRFCRFHPWAARSLYATLLLSALVLCYEAG